MNPAEAEGVVLVIGCGKQPYREYLPASDASRHPLWSSTATEPTWQRDHVAGATVVDLDDQDADVAAAGRIGFPGPGERLTPPSAGFISRHPYVISAGADPDDRAAVLDNVPSDFRLTARPLLPAAARG